MKRFLALILLVAVLISLAGCSLFTSRGDDDDDDDDSIRHNHSVIRTLEDGATTYYCWEDGVVTTVDRYDEDSALYWENDIDRCAYIVKNDVSSVFVSYYEQPTEPTESETETTTEDPYKGHTLEGIVTDPIMGNTYFCWDDGTATMTEEYSNSGLTWTHPWKESFFNIYNGISDNGNVVYSEKSCTWCGDHKVFYKTYVRDIYDYSKETEYLCESCHIDLTSSHIKCSNCSYYYYKTYAIYLNGSYICEKCYWDGSGN